MTRLMDSVSPLPQNWLMRTEEPLWSPKMTNWMTKTGMLATSTAARGASPRAPTMKVSISPSRVVHRFWSRMGRASRATLR